MGLRLFSKHLIRVDAVDSTNNYAAKLLKATKVDNGTAILTKRQTNGKGQRGNSWVSDDSDSLTFSLVVFPDLKTKHNFYLNIVSSLAVRKAIEDCGIEAKIKWPNDILINKKKVCGILIENQIQGQKIQSAIVGIGLNIGQSSFEELPHATSLRIENSRVLDKEDLFEQIYQYLDFYFDQLRFQNFDFLLNQYYKFLFGLNQNLNFINEGQPFEGKIQGIDDSGKLIVSSEKGKKSFQLGEIKYAYQA